ncbi:MAG: TonB family protein [Pyrinomonadaceae bacterium]
MPLNVRRFYTSVFGVLLVFVSFISFAEAQTVPSAAVPQTVIAPAPTSGDVMRERISKAKAFIAVRNYNAAIYELENIRRETSDTTVHGALNVLLMNSYLEQGDYKRAQDLLSEFYAAQKTAKPNAWASYMAVAGQVVKGARSRVERYRALGLSVSDRTLPLEALTDLEKMRETLELVITQSKEIGGDKAKSSDGMALLEEASNSRSMLARDDYDARHWKDEVADTREQMASSRSVVLSAVTETLVGGVPVVANNPPTDQPVMQPVVDTKTTTRDREVKTPENKPADSTVATNENPVYIPSAPPVAKEEPKSPNDTPKTSVTKVGSPLDVGSLKEYATSQTIPTYPPAARSVRASGIVKVQVTVDEKGEVAEVQKTSGPSLLQGAAKDAIRKWKFRPFVRDGQPVKATGFVNFNFAL